MPDRLPSLILLVGFWVPPAVAGWLAAGARARESSRESDSPPPIVAATFIVAYAAAWFVFQLDRIPPYVPGATRDPTFAPPEAIAALLVVAVVLVLPGSALSCALAWRFRRKRHR